MYLRYIPKTMPYGLSRPWTAFWSAVAWVISNNFWFLILVQLFSGTAWAAYELAVFLICFNSIRAEERTSVLTIFNLTTTAAMVLFTLARAARSLS